MLHSRSVPIHSIPRKNCCGDSATDRRILLTEKEAAVLKYLYRSNDRAVDSEKLLHDVWGYNDGITTHTIETHIYRLRKKLEPDPRRPALLVTERNGYRLNPLAEFHTAQVAPQNVERTGRHTRTASNGLRQNH